MLQLARFAMVVPLVFVIGCSSVRSAYYNAWESMGYAKRERLVDNVKAAKDEQVEAKEQFTSALEQFRALVNFNGGDLEKMYNQLNDEYEACVSQADDVRSRIQAVKNVSTALFDEWQSEIKQIGDDSLRADSVRLRDETKRSYDEMIARMDAAAASMDPVLTKFKDRVLSLKHRLNAAAIASLKGEEAKIGADVEKLLADMNASIARADAFIAEIQPEAK